MSESATNSSTSASGYFWKECHPYNDKSGLSAGLLILFTTDLFELLLGAPSNLWLVYHILRKKSKVSGILPADFFPLHLALTQLSFFLVLPLLLINHFLLESESVLAVVTILTSMVVVMKPLLLCLVCVERYMAVVRPIDYLRYKAGWYRWGCLGVLWCIYIPMASSAIYEHSSSTISVVFLPVLIIGTFCSMSVLKTLRKPPPGDRQMAEREKKGREKRKAHKNGRHVVSVEREEQERSSKKEEKVKGVRRNKPRGKAETNSMKRKAFVIIAVIQAVLTLNYLPMIICVFLEGRVPARVLKCQYLALGLAAAVSCSYLQPLLYLHKLGRLSFMKSQNT
ncbi:uncharacterized protein AKAME5_002138600 [Lates japonicus]|uniref:G-protein coupled receptors family 1 profile domain-containing protein n=1 Tax=Lates japonicus TaxID=270547 RepID=A0AAD3NF47_LATJO|nr:uncharacterized protein AKAME5_002138600 [Lates japonicus]